MEATAPFFPLRWESTGDQWWFASPVDLAAATGRYDLLRALLRGDPNLLIQLTSLRRLRRLETVWDDDSRFAAAPRNRSSIARALLVDTGGALLRDGYSGWLLYTAASAGDLAFAEELLHGNPLMAFGEGEFGVTDMLYAAARGRNAAVFWMVFGAAMRFGGDGEDAAVLASEMKNRAVHASARGGIWEVLMDLLRDCEDVLAFRDVKGSTILHSAAGKGQVEIVKGLIGSFDIIDSRDNHGNTSLHIASFRGHLPVVEILIDASPASVYSTNNSGDTFLHVAIAGFKTPGFHWVDRQMELIRHLVSGSILDIKDIINLRNNDGRTVLHMAVAENAHPDLVSILMSISSIDLNIRDADGMTPLDLLRQHPQSTSSEILIKRLISSGAMPNLTCYTTRSIISSQMKMQSIWSSPGTSFQISDTEIFSYTGIKFSDANGFKESGEPSSHVSSVQNLCQSEVSVGYKDLVEMKKHPSRRLKNLLSWPRKKKVGILQTNSDSVHSSADQSTLPLRERFSKAATFPTNKRTLSARSDSMPSPATKKQFTTRLMHGVIEAVPRLALLVKESVSSPSRVVVVQHPGKKQVDVFGERESEGVSASSSLATNATAESSSQRCISKKTRLMNKCFCLGSHSLAVQEPHKRPQLRDYFKNSVLSAA